MRDKLEAAWYAIHPEPLPDWQRHGTFNALLSIGTDEAFLAAAMMLVPEGRGRGAFAINRDSFGRAHCNVWTDAEFNRYVHGSGPTPAAALLSAILSTKENTHVE